MTKHLFLAALCVLLMAGVAGAQGFGPAAGDGTCAFVDENCDGFNDLAPDADGDGIPNGQDPDWVRPEDGTGRQLQHRRGQFGTVGEFAQGFANAYAFALAFAYAGEGPGQGAGQAHAYGPGDGTGNMGEGPADGTGFGPGNGDGDGTCDGDGDGLQNRRAGRR